MLNMQDKKLGVRTLNQPNLGIATAIGHSLKAQGLCLCDEIVRRCFRRQGLGTRVMRKKLLLRKRHRKKYLQWTKASHDCHVENWSHVI